MVTHKIKIKVSTLLMEHLLHTLHNVNSSNKTNMTMEELVIASIEKGLNVGFFDEENNND